MNNGRTIISETHPFNSKYLRVIQTSYRIDGEAADTQPHTYFHVTRPNAKAIIAILLRTSNGEFILNKQYRMPIHTILIEPVAGLVGDKGNEGLEDAIQRECEEEVGYKPQETIRLTSSQIAASAGLIDETYYLFLGTGCKPTPKKDSGEASEHGMETMLLTEKELLQEFRNPSSPLIDAKLAVLMWYYILYTQENPLTK